MRNEATRTKTFDARGVAYQAFLGFAFGYLLLHPISMVIFQWLDPRFAHAIPGDSGNPVLGAVLHSFQPSMFAMGLAYALLAGLVAAVNGYYRQIIENQRDALRIQNEQLARLERTNRRNTQFMMHDLKTHVGCIFGFANLLLDQEKLDRSPANLDALMRIRRQAMVITDSIAELLDLARLQETGKLHREEISPAELLQDAVEVFSPLPEGRTILIGATASECPRIMIDKSLLGRVVTNLVGNSLKHNRGNLRVLLNAEHRSGSSELLFTCIDNGSGIPPQVLDKIFEEFESSALEKHESSGLGLAFCKAAVEAHGGRIWCESDGHVGTSLSLTVPLYLKENENE